MNKKILALGAASLSLVIGLIGINTTTASAINDCDAALNAANCKTFTDWFGATGGPTAGNTAYVAAVAATFSATATDLISASEIASYTGGIDISGTAIAHPSSIDLFTNITSLNIANNPLFIDPSIIASLTNLTTLDLSGNTNLQDVTALASLTSLKTLSLSKTSVLDITPLSTLSSLEHLDLSSAGMMTDAEIAAGVAAGGSVKIHAEQCQAIKAAGATGCFRDLQPIQAILSHLKTLNLKNTLTGDQKIYIDIVAAANGTVTLADGSIYDQFGARGPQGDTGAAGQNGRDGLDGVNGITGLRGPAGLNGRDGKDGKDGVNGKDGANGHDGRDGATGETGADGSPAPGLIAGIISGIVAGLGSSLIIARRKQD